MSRLKAFEILEEIAEEYQHLAQGVNGKVDVLRRRRYKWLMKFVERLRKLGV